MRKNLCKGKERRKEKLKNGQRKMGKKNPTKPTLKHCSKPPSKHFLRFSSFHGTGIMTVPFPDGETEAPGGVSFSQGRSASKCWLCNSSPGSLALGIAPPRKKKAEGVRSQGKEPRQGYSPCQELGCTWKGRCGDAWRGKDKMEGL